ncbi:interleukin-6 [Sinocyclocheilus rhinocerous]|uniref:interleukin-6 n=1 Tax=Sinocyclocheilus rhinocerous TaxID=307959 RepID=UPI0007B9B282|nr:PREDICTED: interleukin-6-like [Sinocyclocheilus rhinocerous]
MPSAQNAALFLSAVLAAFLSLVHAVPAYSGLAELSETSGDEVQDVEGKSPLSERQKWHLMARDLHRDVKTLRDQQFERDFRETVNMTAYEGVRITTPLLTPSDGCLSRNFSADLCLSRIYSILSWYEENWSLIENENLTSSLVKDIKRGTKRLLEAINSQLQIADGGVDQISRAPLSVRSAWMRKTTTHSILFNFTSVMIDTCRAVHYMSKRKAAHRAKDTKRPADWSSDKN